MIALLKCYEERIDVATPEGEWVSQKRFFVHTAIVEQGTVTPDMLEGRTVDELIQAGWRFPRCTLPSITSVDPAVVFIYLEWGRKQQG